MLNAMGPFLVPIGSFVVTLFVSWNHNFFLITLANFTAQNARWAKTHLSACQFVSDKQVETAFRNFGGKKAFLRLNPKDTPIIFDELRREMQRKEV